MRTFLVSILFLTVFVLTWHSQAGWFW